MPLNNQISNIGFEGTHTGKKIPLSMNMPTKIINIDEIKNPPDVVYNNNLDLISMENIVHKVINDSLLKRSLIKIIKRKNIDIIKRTLHFKL